MAVPLYTPYDPDNLYFTMLTTSALIPPIAMNISEFELNNAIYDELEAYSGKSYEQEDGTVITMNPNPNYGFDMDWVQDFTAIDASFNRNLEAGQLKGVQGQKVTEIILQRSSVRDGFYHADDVATFKANEEGEVYAVFDDYMIESGVLYKYSLLPVSTLRDAYGNTMSELRAPVVGQKYCIADYEGCWLIGPDRRQIKIDYNPKISNMKHVVKDNVIETLGSKYPFIVRNSSVNYRQFNFNGTITVEMDAEGMIIGDGSYVELFYDGSLNNLDEVTQALIEREYSKYIPSISSPGSGKNNYIVEREFRNRLVEWLNDGKSKVFKSDTEGLILCKITNVSFEPIQALGRMIYNFSCTVSEIEEINKETLRNYGIMPEYEKKEVRDSAHTYKL